MHLTACHVEGDPAGPAAVHGKVVRPTGGRS
jgi:hypothetical protein